VLPGSDEARKMTATSGRKLLEYSRRSDPVGLLVKMLLGTSLWASTTCLLTWGGRVTPRKRFLYQLRPSAPATDETEFSLWRAPAAANANQGPKSKEFYEHCLRTGQSTITLVDEVRHNPGKLWPTPQAHDAKPGSADRVGRFGSKHGGRNLNDYVMLWPTPTANDAKNATLPPSAKDWDSIPGAIMREGHTAQEGQLNPEWVEMLMNFPRGWTDME